MPDSDTRNTLSIQMKPTITLLCFLLAVTLCGGPGPWAQEGGEPSGAKVPFYLEGVNLELPSQEGFRTWPPASLVERLYPHPWAFASFQKATLFARPVVLVLTVNWNRSSQRLASETLQTPAVIRAINQDYIVVLVNADLRPDVRARYESGVWPVVSLLLPDGNPMLSQAHEMEKAVPITTGAVTPELMEFFIEEGAVYWDRWPGLLMRSGAEWARSDVASTPEAGSLDTEASERLARALAGNADRVDGGFGALPKFLVPGVSRYAALLDARGVSDLTEHGRLTLEKLVASPLYDSKDGGLHRLAAGPAYTKIEYEKLLRINAAFVEELTDSLRIEDSEKLRRALGETAKFIVDVLGDPEGGFHLAQFADGNSSDGGGYWERPGAGSAPAVDPLILSGPNALAGAALIRAGALLDRQDLREIGLAALERVHAETYSPGRGVFHAIQPAGDPRLYLSTLADVAAGFIDAYEFTGDPRFLEATRQVVDATLLNLREGEIPALRDSLPEARTIGLLANPRRPLRPNVRLARSLVRLSRHGLDPRYGTLAKEILEYFCGDLSVAGGRAVEAGIAIEEMLTDPLRIRINGPPADPQTRELRRLAASAPWLWTVIESGDPDRKPGAELFWKGKRHKVKKVELFTETITDVTRRR